MKRYVWLLLLISLGLNVGLGWRLVNRNRQASAEMRSDRPLDGGDRPWRNGHRDGDGRRGGSGIDREFMRPDVGDSTAWRKVMDARLDRMARRLDLAPEQVERFRQTQHGMFDRVHGRRMRIRQAEERLMEMTKASSVNPDSIRIAVHELGRSKSQLDSLVAESLLSELDSLTPEQREKYLRMLPWSKSGMGRGRGSGPDERGNQPPEPPLPGE